MRMGAPLVILALTGNAGGTVVPEPEPRNFSTGADHVFTADLPAPTTISLGPGPLVETSRDGEVDVFHGGAQTWVKVQGARRRELEDTGRVDRVAVSSDDTQVATYSVDGVVSIYEVASGERLGRWTVPRAPAGGGVIFSGTWAVVHTGCRLVRVEAGRKQVHAMDDVWCEEADMTAASASRVTVVDIGEGLGWHEGHFAVMPAERSGDQWIRRSVQLIEPSSGHVRGDTASATRLPIDRFGVSPSASTVCFATGSELWCPSEDGWPYRLIASDVSPRSGLAFSPDAGRLVYTTTAGAIVVVDLARYELRTVATSAMTQVVWLDDTTLAAFGAADRQGYELYDLAEGRMTTVDASVTIAAVAATALSGRYLVTEVHGGAHLVSEAWLAD